MLIAWILWAIGFGLMLISCFVDNERLPHVRGLVRNLGFCFLCVAIGRSIGVILL